MNKIIKTILTIICVVLSFQIFTSTTIAADSKYLNIEGIKQEQTEWCWAATSKSIIDYLKGTNPTQSEIVTSVKGSPVNEGADFSEDESSLTNFEVTTTAAQSTISFSSIENYISGWYSPIKATIWWKSGSGGHDLVIYGYYSDLITSNVSYMDPWPANPTWNSRSYSSFVSNSSWDWGWTFYQNY